MYVCMYICMYACMYVGRQVGMQVCMQVCMYVCMYVCRALSSLSVLSSTRYHLIFQCSTSSTKSTFLGKSLYQVLHNLSTHCLLLVLIYRPLNYPRFPRRQGIGIFSSSRMGCLQDNSRSVHLYYIHYIYLNMEHIYMRIPVRKWSIDLKKKPFWSNLCKGTRLLEPNVATCTPLYGTLDEEKHNTICV